MRPKLPVRAKKNGKHLCRLCPPNKAKRFSTQVELLAHRRQGHSYWK